MMPLRGRLKAQGSRIKVGRKKEAGGEISARIFISKRLHAHSPQLAAGVASIITANPLP
jgi:hypothetical protein